MTRAQKMFCTVLIAVGLLASIWVAVGRIMVEQMNNTVGIVVDWREVRELAAASGITPRDALFTLQSAGATHLSIAEQSLADLIDSGDIKLFGRGDQVDVLAGDASVVQQLVRGLSARYPANYERQQVTDNEIWLAAPAITVLDRRVGAGYSRSAAEAAAQSGMTIVARPVSFGVRTRPAVQAVISQAADIGAEFVIFSGERVVGFPRLVDETADAMRQAGLTHGIIEMSPQHGAGELATRLDHNVVRVHSITDGEMQTISVDRAVERFTRAARERGVRLLYLRLLPTGTDGLLESNAGYVGAVRDQLRAHGYVLGEPSPARRYSTAPWLLALVTLGVYGGILWLVQALFGLPGRYFWPLAAIVILGGTGMMLVAAGPVRLLAALTAAIVFPVIAVGWTARDLGRAKGTPPLGAALGRLIAAFLAVSAVTFFGGLLVVGLLGDSKFMLHVDQFRGVKIAHLVPVIVIALLWLGRSMDAYRNHHESAGPDLVDYHTGDTFPEWPALWAGLRQALSGLIAYWHVAAAFVGLAALAMLLVRSGNEAFGAVLPMEMELRSALDRLLSVRPRSKEVFVGHPVMLLALLLAMRGMRPGIWIAFAIGVIGQVSLLNSFAHVHTPLLLTLLRVFNGIWLGALGGIVLCAIWDWLGGAPERAPDQEQLPLDEDDLDE